MNQSQPDLDAGRSGAEDWTLGERIQVLWDRSAVRWLVALFAGALVFALVMATRSSPHSEPSASGITAVGAPAPQASPVTALSEPSAASTAPLSASVSSPPAAANAAVVIVDVVGPVRNPGVVTLPSGSRVADAVAAAGGLAKGKTKINLARVLVDGEQIDVAAPAASGQVGLSGEAAAGAGASSPGGSSGVGLVNLNSATSGELEDLPRIGPVTAGKIIDFRTQYGGFRSVEQLKEVPGIGDVTFSGLASLITV